MDDYAVGCWKLTTLQVIASRSIPTPPLVDSLVIRVAADLRFQNNTTLTNITYCVFFYHLLDVIARNEKKKTF